MNESKDKEEIKKVLNKVASETVESIKWWGLYNLFNKYIGD